MRLWIRADASPAIGIGHVMRTLACAEEATDRGISVEYVMAREPHTNTIPADHGYQCRIIDHCDDQSWIGSVAFGDVVLFDGYHFGSTDFEAARESGATVAAIDDLGYGPFPVDVLINQNLGRPADYTTRADTQLLLGPNYAMVRSEFRAKRRHRGNGSSTLVISFGGSDVANLSRPVLELALESTFQRILLLVGPAAGAYASSLPPTNKQVDIVRTPVSVADVFDQADVVVSGAGSTTWELLCMGLPAILVEVTDNQAGIGQSVEQIGAGLFGGTPTEISQRLPAALEKLNTADFRMHLSSRCLETVDGLGVYRVLDALKTKAP